MYTRLRVGFPAAPAVVLGAFQRSSEVGAGPLIRRASGGGAFRVGPGTLWVQVELTLEGLPADKLVNRHVRPLMRALTKLTSVPAHWFGRDWISMAHRPAAFVGFAHEAALGTGLLEAIVAVDETFSGDRPSFIGKAPATLAELAEKSIDHEALIQAITAAYELPATALEPPPLVTPEPAWSATRAEAIGIVAAGRDATGRMRVGGELMASRDAVAALEAALAAGIDVDRAVDDAFTTNGAVIYGVKSLASIRDAILAAAGQT